MWAIKRSIITHEPFVYSMKHFLVLGHQIGAATFPMMLFDPDQGFKKCDIALNRAKEEGRLYP